jgi:hypothetical protein
MTTTDNPVDQLGEGIRAGLFDADLDRLERAITARRATVARFAIARGDAGVTPQSFADAPIGSRFRIELPPSHGPKYLNGLRGTVTRHRQKKVVFTFEPGQYTGKFGTSIIMELPFLRSL